MADFGSQSVLHWSGTGRELDDVVGGMAGLQGLNKEVGGQQLEVTTFQSRGSLHIDQHRW